MLIDWRLYISNINFYWRLNS